MNKINFITLGKKYADSYVNGGCDEVNIDMGESYIRDDFRETLGSNIEDDVILDNFEDIEDGARIRLLNNGYEEVSNCYFIIKTL
jgi:hypothetical protein